ncbi:hypothetical protein ACFP3U_33345 [Kitasatospora misakiensis]|uniref:Uncharacterized protein n=1 Tax=Kitasatospora misakiensis TaxID=67330 RepID=A0ABW0XBA9_9ACTN
MSGTFTCISRTPAGTAVVEMAATGQTYVDGRPHGEIADPGSTESPHAIRPVPENG